jgi:hypothetical protein
MRTDDPTPTPQRSTRAASRIRQAVALIEKIATWPTLRPMRVRWQLFTLIVVLALLGLAARASADTLRLSEVHYSATSGAIEVTVTSSAPPNSAIALNLYRDRCPPSPAATDYNPIATPDGQPHQLLASPPQPGETGPFRLCVWTVNENGAVGAQRALSTQIPADAAAPALTLPSYNAHPGWWVLPGWLTVAVMLAVIAAMILLPAGLIAAVAKRLRRHYGRRSSTENREEQERLEGLQAAAESDSPAEQPTLEHQPAQTAAPDAPKEELADTEEHDALPDPQTPHED